MSNTSAVINSVVEIINAVTSRSADEIAKSSIGCPVSGDFCSYLTMQANSAAQKMNSVSGEIKPLMQKMIESMMDEESDEKVSLKEIQQLRTMFKGDFIVSHCDTISQITGEKVSRTQKCSAFRSNITLHNFAKKLAKISEAL